MARAAAVSRHTRGRLMELGCQSRTISLGANMGVRFVLDC
jgi:hypothetical protein